MNGLIHSWTQYATPFQSKGLAIYGLNLVVIPFGVIDWSTKYNESLFDYIILATLGNAIAHQIAHHFDANGILTIYNNRNVTDVTFVTAIGHLRTLRKKSYHSNN